MPHLLLLLHVNYDRRKSITIRKVEIDDENDVVTNSSFNGWIKQEVTFVAKALG